MTINFTPTPVLYIFIGLIVGILIGWAIGFFDSNGRADKKIKIAEANAESKIREAEKKIAQADEKFSLESRLSPSVKDDPGLLRLKKNNGRITVEMDGTQLSEVLSADRKKRLIKALPPVFPGLTQMPKICRLPPKQLIYIRWPSVYAIWAISPLCSKKPTAY